MSRGIFEDRQGAEARARTLRAPDEARVERFAARCLVRGLDDAQTLERMRPLFALPLSQSGVPRGAAWFLARIVAARRRLAASEDEGWDASMGPDVIEER